MSRSFKLSPLLAMLLCVACSSDPSGTAPVEETPDAALPDSGVSDMSDALPDLSQDMPVDLSETQDLATDMPSPDDLGPDLSADMLPEEDLGPSLDMPADMQREDQAPDMTLPCVTQAGTRRAQRLTVDGQERAYLLHVPADLPCDQPVPVLFDFHGFSGAPAPEEAYQLQGAIDFSEAHDVLLVRPRGLERPANQGGGWAWEDLAAHQRMISELFTALSGEFLLDDSRSYVLGFSNGTYMSMMILEDADPRFAGVAVIGGGFGTMRPGASIVGAPQKVYTSTGYRDLYHANTHAIFTTLPEAQVADRAHPGGHNLRPYHYEEAWRFWEDGVRPGELSSAPKGIWSVSASTPDGQSAMELLHGPSEDVIYSAYMGNFRMSHATTLTYSRRAPTRTSPVHPVDACRLSNGDLIVVTGTGGFRDVAGLRSPISISSQAYPYAALCRGALDVELFGLERPYKSVDGGNLFVAGSYGSAFVSGIHDVARSASGTTIGVGAYLSLIRRQSDGGSFQNASLPMGTDYINDLYSVTESVAGTWWAAGTSGMLLRSQDNGASFARVTLPTEEDFYAITFRDGQTGAVVGSHGAVWLTRDGGQSWSDVSTGEDRYLGAAHFVGGELVVLGEGGYMAKMTL